MATVMYKNKLFLVGLCCVFYMTFTLEAARSKGKNNDRNHNDLKRQSFRGKKTEKRYYGPMRDERHGRSEKPNIILIITDDQDEVLGSVTTMTKTMKIMGQEGVRFNNSFVSTPMCCPSRSSLLTGMYPHNHHVYTNNDNCSGTEWQKIHEPRTFAKYLSDAGYRTGFFGKYLNEYNGTYIPPGWREWVGLVRNSQFYNYTLNFNGQKVKHDDNYYQDYFTDLIANDSVTFLKQSKQYFPTKPVMMMLSVPAPHGPEDSAPQYQHMFENNTLHRTPSWNYMNNSDKQWLLSVMKPLDPQAVAFTDILQRKRLQTLQSVDSLVEKVHYTLRMLGELDNTYIIFTSDHGYHLGQFGILKGKALPYDFDIRVPFFIRGPGILRDTKIPNVVGNVDVAPTILDMAGIAIPDHMDGRSVMKLIRNHKLAVNLEGDFVEVKRPWRDTFLVERGKVTKRMIKGIEREQDNRIMNEYEDELIPYADSKLRRTLKVCKDPNNQPPCKYEQKWVCFKDSRGRKRIKKCRNYNKTVTMETGNGYQRDRPFSFSSNKQKPCDCSRKQARNIPYMTADELEIQKQFLKNHVNDEDFVPNFVRQKRSPTYQEEEMALRKSLIAQQLNVNRQRCRFLQNDTFFCDKDITKDPEKWNSHKLQLDEMIEETRKRLRNLKKIRKNMKKQKRPLKKDPWNVESNDSDEITAYNKYYHGNMGNQGNNIPDEPCDCDDDNDDDDDDEIDPFHMPPELSNIGEDRYGADSEEDAGYVPYSAKFKKNGRRKVDSCDHNNLKCKIQDNTHWQTPPYWTLGPICVCTNAELNTYWCLRTVNSTHDFLYCEFVNNFLSFYDFKTDPHQLRNQIKSLDYDIMRQLHEDLEELRKCQGGKQCNKKKYITDLNDRRRRRRRRTKDRKNKNQRSHVRQRAKRT